MENRRLMLEKISKKDAIFFRRNFGKHYDETAKRGLPYRYVLNVNIHDMDKAFFVICLYCMIKNQTEADIIEGKEYETLEHVFRRMEKEKNAAETCKKNIEKLLDNNWQNGNAQKILYRLIKYGMSKGLITNHINYDKLLNDLICWDIHSGMNYTRNSWAKTIYETIKTEDTEKEN